MSQAWDIFKGSGAIRQLAMEPRTIMYVIKHTHTGQFAGARFPARMVSEYPDAVKFSTHQAASAALRGAYHEAGGIDAVSKFAGCFEIVEVD